MATTMAKAKTKTLDLEKPRVSEEIKDKDNLAINKLRKKFKNPNAIDKQFEMKVVEFNEECRKKTGKQLYQVINTIAKQE